MKQYNKDLGRVSVVAEGIWSKDKEYDKLSIVYNKLDKSAYISRKEIPVGTQIDNRDYWQPLNVTGYSDNNFINLTAPDDNGNIISYNNILEAVNDISIVNRKVGAIVSFYNTNKDRLDVNAEFEIWQFNSIDINNWTNVDYWQNIYYNWNAFVGWYIDSDSLNNSNPNPRVGQYAYVGGSLNTAYLHQCRSNGAWTNTNVKYREYVSVVVSGNVTIGDNGNWYVDGSDTGIPSTPAIDDTIEQLKDKLIEHDDNFKDYQSQIDNYKNKVDKLESKTNQLSESIKSISVTGGASTAEAVAYDNIDGTLQSTDVKSALDELSNKTKYITQDDYDALLAADEIEDDVEYNIIED